MLSTAKAKRADERSRTWQLSDTFRVADYKPLKSSTGRACAARSTCRTAVRLPRLLQQGRAQKKGWHGVHRGSDRILSDPGASAWPG